MIDITRTARVWMVAFSIFSLVACPDSVFAQGNAAPKLDPPSAAAVRIFKAAAKAQNANNFQFGAELWEDFLKKHPKTTETPRAEHYAGICHLQLKAYEKAAAHFQTVTTTWSKTVAPVMLQDALLNLGSCHFELAKKNADTAAESYGKAADTFGELLKNFPAGAHTDQALYFQAESLYWKGDKAQAVESYAKLVNDVKLKSSSFRDDAAYLLGVTYQELKKFDDASKTFDVFIKDFADNPLIHEVKMRKGEMVLLAGRAAAKDGNADQASGLFKDALARLEEVAKVESFNKRPYALLKLGECHNALKDFANAAKAYAQLAETYSTSPHTGEARLNAARNFYNANQDADTLKWCQAVIDNDAANAPEATHWLCRVHIKNGDFDKVVEQAGGILPRAAESRFLVDLKMDKADALYAIADRTIEALLLYEAIAKDHADHAKAPEALYYAAFAAMQLEKTEQALASVETFRTSFADHYFLPDVNYIAAKCKLLTKKPAEAEMEFKALIANYKTHEHFELWHILLGQSLLNQEKYDEVIATLSPMVKAIKSPAIAAEGHYFLGLSQFELAKHAEAAAEFEASLAADAKWTNADLTAIYWARTLHKSDKTDDAIVKVKEAISGFPDSRRLDEAYYRLGEFSYAKSDYEAANGAYSKVIESWPDSAFTSYAHFWKGWAQTEDKKYDGAIASFTTFLDGYPEHDLVSDARYARGACRRLNGDYEDAVKDLTEFLATNPDKKDACSAHFEKGRALVKLDEFKAATESFQEVTKLDPKYEKADEVAYELAWAYKLDGEAEEALKTFRRIIKDYPDSSFAADAHFRDGEDLYTQSKFEESKAAYAKAKGGAESGSLKEAITYKLGWSNYQLEKFDEALKEFSEQTKDYPAGSLFHSGLFMQGEAFFKLKKRQEALPLYTKLLSDKDNFAKLPDNTKMLVHLHGGQCAVEAKKWDDALKYLSPIPTNYAESMYIHQAHFEIGRCHEGLKKEAEALASYEKATNGPDGLSARAYYMIGEIHFKRKEFDQAIKQYKLVLLMNEKDEEVKKWQGYACFEAGRCFDVRIMDATGPQRTQFIADAKKYYGDVVSKYPGSPAQLQASAKDRLSKLASIK